MKTFFVSIAWAWMLLASGQIAWAEAHEGSHGGKSCSIGPYFISPQDGDVVSGNVSIKMGIKGMRVHKAGELIEGTGHHHLIIDGGYVPENEVVPKDDKHIHFGGGQMETTIKLAPGKHTLTLQFADGHHQSYGKIMSKTIEITVK